MHRQITFVAGLLAVTTACYEKFEEPRDVKGNFEVEYEDNLRVYINGSLVADVQAGEDAAFEWDGEMFQVSQVCGDEGVECPSETYWRDVAVVQPHGTSRMLLNFINLDDERGQAGQRMGGLMTEEGDVEMLAGLALGADNNCAAIGVGAVFGKFDDANEVIDDGTIAYEWGAGCVIGSFILTGSLRLETDYSAFRYSDLDLSTVRPEPAIDENGDPIPDEDLSEEEAAL